MAENNKVLIRGKVTGLPEFKYGYSGNDFYEFKVQTKRDTGKTDEFGITIPWTKVNHLDLKIDDYIEIDCEFRSFRNKRRTIYYLYYIDSKPAEANALSYAQASLRGTLTRRKVCDKFYFPSLKRETKMASGNLKIDSFNRSYSAPIIFWGKGADIAASYEIGSEINVEGLVSVRNFSYTNKETGCVEERTQLEVTAIRSNAIEVNNEQ